MPYRVLIVDDQREVTRMLRSGFETLDEAFKVVEVPSGEEALLEARLGKFDLLVTDVRLPGMSGLDLMKKTRAQNPAMKVVLLTGVADPKIRREVAEAGADAFFLKPIELADFLDSVEQVLGLVKTAPPIHARQAPELIVAVPSENPELQPNVPNERGVSEHLADLRQSLGAISALMLNDRGQVLVQAGDLPDMGIEAFLIPSLMSTFSVGQKIAHYLGMNTPENLFVFNGQKYHLVMSLVGRSYALLIVTHHPANAENLGRVGPIVQQAVRDLLDILTNMGVTLHLPEEKTQVPPFEPSVEFIEEDEVPEDDIEIDEIFTLAAKDFFALTNADDYWENGLNEDTTATLSSADVLSYEQALQLGLAPSEEEPL